MKALILSFLVSFSMHVAGIALASESDLDPAFGVGGMVLLDQWRSVSPIHSIVQQSDGKLVLASSSYGYADRLSIARLNTDGTLDPSFGVAGITTGDIDREVAVDVIEQLDRKLVVAGYTWGGPFVATIWRFESNGDTDATFGTNGAVHLELGDDESVWEKLAQQVDGKLVVAGVTQSVPGRLVLARFDSGGNFDASFGSAGTSFIDLAGHSNWLHVTALLPQEDGRLIVAGHTLGHVVIVRITDQGELDDSFGSGGFTAIAATEIDSEHTFTAGGSAVIDEDGDILVSASVMHCEISVWGDCILSQDGFIVRLKPSGSLDPTLGQGKIVVRDLGFSSIVVEADDTIVCAFDDRIHVGLMKFKSDGSVDTGFGIKGTTTADFESDDLWSLYVAQSMILQADGKHVVVAAYTIASSNIGWYAFVARFGAAAQGFAGFLGAESVNSYAFEGGDSALIRVGRTGGSSGEVSVAFQTMNGTALAELDYVSHSGLLHWSDGDDSVKQIVIAVIDDSQIESSSPEVFGLQLSDPTNGAQLANSLVSITIEDNDAVSAPAPPPPPAPTVGGGLRTGGGGATGLELLVLFGLLSAFARRKRHTAGN